MKLRLAFTLGLTGLLLGTLAGCYGSSLCPSCGGGAPAYGPAYSAPAYGAPSYSVAPQADPYASPPAAAVAPGPTPAPSQAPTYQGSGSR